MSLTERLKSIFDVSSLRKNPSEEKYKPDHISEKCKNRILFLYKDFISGHESTYFNDTHPFWKQIRHSLQLVHGRMMLSNDSRVRSDAEDVLAFLKICNTSEFFDFIELSFKLRVPLWVTSYANEVVDSINEIFHIENAPYQLTKIVIIKEKFPNSANDVYTERISAYPQIIRSEDAIIHREAVEPVLAILSESYFEAANEEFRSAMNEYRQGNFNDCLTKCGSAFESILKVICHKKKYNVREKATSGPLLKKLISESRLDSSLFEPSLKVIADMRNQLSSAHGGGSKVRTPERHIAQYAISSTAAAIVLLVREFDI